MAYDEALADRLRDLLDGEPGLVEKRMFGGLAFLLDGHIGVAATDRGLMLRVPTEDLDAALAEPGVDPVVMQGRPMTGWVYVAADASTPAAELGRWVELGVRHVRTLPPT